MDYYYYTCRRKRLQAKKWYMVHIYTLFQEIFQAVTHLLPLHSNTFVTSQYLKIYPKYIVIYILKKMDKSKRYISNNFFVCILQKSPFTSQSVFAYSHTALVVDMWLNRPEILKCQTRRLRSILSKNVSAPDQKITTPLSPHTFDVARDDFNHCIFSSLLCNASS